MSGLRLALEWALVFILMTLVFLRKHRIHLLSPVILTFFITFFALLSPTGKVLTTVSSFKITQDSLFLGLHKSAVLVGIVFLSQTIVSYKLSLPGRIGVFLHQIFFYYDRLASPKIYLTKGHVIEQIDEKLLSLWNHRSGDS